MVNRSYLLKTFPEINKIKDKILRSKVIEIWLRAIKRGCWQKIDSIPFTLLIPTKKTLVKHTRTVTQMAMAIAQRRGDLNLDRLIAGGITHDVGKLLEYQFKNGKFIKSSYGKLVRHPVSGYGLAVEVGLPVEIAHIIATHSEEGEQVARSPEAIVIHHCDFVDFDIARTKS